MDINNNNNNENDTNEETSSLSVVSPSFCSTDNIDLDDLHEYENKYVTEELEDEGKTNDHRNKCNRKRHRSMEDGVMMEKRRRQGIRDKVNVLAAMTPNCYRTKVNYF
ncbi:unnamed protein product [Cochlearia groenlandica]